MSYFEKVTVVDKAVETPQRIKLTDAYTEEVLGTFDYEKEEGTVTAKGTAQNKDFLQAMQDTLFDTFGDVDDIDIALTPTTQSASTTEPIVSSPLDFTLTGETTVDGDNLVSSNNFRIESLGGLDNFPTTWAEVQEIVRSGQASNIFKVGNQFVCDYNGSNVVWDIIGIDHDTPTDPTYSHSLTIQAHDCILDALFDAPEPTNPDANRQLYGSNNYDESAIKQWLNSNDASFTWVAQTAYDVAPTGAPYTGAGFLNLLDSELVAVLGTVDKQVANNTVTDGGGQTAFSNKVFLLSRKEVYGTDEGVVTGEETYEYYSDMALAATDASVTWRVKYFSSNPNNWWLRSPHISYSGLVRSIYINGVVTNDYAYSDIGVAPACVIV